MSRTLSDDGAAFIAGQEGAVPFWYLDRLGNWTIGIGHLWDGSDEFADVAVRDEDGTIGPGRRLNDAEMWDLFRADAVRYVEAVDRLVTAELTQWQFDMLVDFAFNWGIGDAAGFPATSVLRLVNARDFGAVARELVDGRGPATVAYPTGRPYDKGLDGVRRRRKLEAEAFVAVSTSTDIIRRVAARLEGWGVPVAFHPEWENWGRPTPHNPRVVRNHHTATRGYGADYPSLDLVHDGRSDLAGPLSQFGIGRHTGTVYVIADGTANDGGPGDWDGVTGNSQGWGIEMENDGVGEEWGPEIRRSALLLNVALCLETPIDPSRVCFAAGTLVLCRDRLRPIEDVEVGQEVWTHQARWRSVTAVMQRTAETVKVRGHGHPGIVTTGEHPFLAYANPSRTRRRGATGSWMQRGPREWADPTWVPASEMIGHWWASPVLPNTGDEVPLPDGFTFSPELAWVLGCWAGDGCASGDRVAIYCTPGTEGDVAERVRAAGLRCTATFPKSATASRVSFTSGPLAAWFADHFGKLAHGKRLPTWLLGTEEKLRQSFLDGYLYADGYGHPGGHHEAFSVSKDLAIGIKLLAQTLGYRTALYYQSAPASPSFIQGREVTCRPKWNVRLHRYESDRWQSAFRGDHLLGRVRSVALTGREEPVYNLSVDEDESYVADGLIVHNCEHYEWSIYKIDRANFGDPDDFRAEVRRLVDQGGPGGPTPEPEPDLEVPDVFIFDYFEGDAHKGILYSDGFYYWGVTGETLAFYNTGKVPHLGAKGAAFLADLTWRERGQPARATPTANAGPTDLVEIAGLEGCVTLRGPVAALSS